MGKGRGEVIGVEDRVRELYRTEKNLGERKSAGEFHKNIGERRKNGGTESGEGPGRDSGREER